VCGHLHPFLPQPTPRLERHGLPQISEPGLLRFPREGVDQVDAHVAESRLPRESNASLRLRRVVIVGGGIPMFLGAMIAGPLGGLAIKTFDKAVEGKVKAGFEMLVNNFSAGIIGAIPASTDGYYDATQTVQLTAVPAPGFSSYETRRPFDNACHPRGTVTIISVVALSFGKS